MALKDMKSDLSKFRMPKKEPLESKKREDIKATQNQTPLSSMVDSAPKIPRSQTTTNKEGVNPQPIDQREKFKGETSPTPMDKSEKFLGETSPTPMSLEERYLGQTDPKKMDNSEKFLGETNPSKMDNSEKFLGETTPSVMDNSEKYLGETTPKPSDMESKFLGETTPSPMDNRSNYLGETTPKPMSLEERFLGETDTNLIQQGDKFKGETDPTKFDNTSNFVRFRNENIDSPYATEPNRMNLDSKFLGETTPTEMNNESQFLGETTPKSAAPTSQFLGETTPFEMNNKSQFLGETTPTSAEPTSQFLGETTPAPFKVRSNKDEQAVTPPSVDAFPNTKAIGFTQNFTDKTKSKFVGVNPDQTQFDTATSLYGNFTDSFNGLSFRAGYGKFKIGTETGNTQRYNPDTKYYVDTQLTNAGISKLQEMRSSPSFLDEMYNKFNLRDDAYNSNLTAFNHPLILRGIQRKGISKGEPQSFGFGLNFDDGLVRSGIVTSVERAAIDAVRLGKWMVSIPGLMWGIKNFGLQQANPNVETLTGKRLTKIWTPINTLASALGGFVGLHPKRHGITPFDPPVETYGATQTAKRVTHSSELALGLPFTGNRLVQLYNETFTIVANTIGTSKFVGEQFNTLIGPGGPNSLYGLIPNGQVPSRNVSTISDLFSGFTVQNQYNPIGNDPSTGPTAGTLPSLPFNRDNSDIGEKIKPYTEFQPERNPTSDPNEEGNKKAGITHNDEFTYGENRSSDVQGSDYEGNDLELAYQAWTSDNLPSDGALNRGVTHKVYGNPFKKQKNSEGTIHSIEKNVSAGELIKGYETIAYGKIPTRAADDTVYNDFRSYLSDKNNGYARAEKENYTEDNIVKRVKFGDTAPRGTDKSDRKSSISKDGINSLGIGETDNDLIQLRFESYDKGEPIQFRAAVSGITETFSPSWDSFKYNGRADQAYNYSTFERSLSFNFQVYATSRGDMAPIYKKLQRLSTMTMPIYGTKGYMGALIKFTLGAIWKNKLAFIESLSYTFSDELPWDLDYEASMGVDVSIGLKVLDNHAPVYGASDIYNLEGVEATRTAGLIPLDEETVAEESTGTGDLLNNLANSGS